jgi:hypothetical protein
VATYYGSEEFGSGFYSIPAAELKSPPLDQMNYAHITVEKGEVSCRDIEHEFDVWAASMKINWRFFAKVVSPTEFRTRFPSAKAIEELSHFGKLFMRTVPEAIINIEKWSGDIEPISVMQEAWFRIKGIPMRFRSKSTAYYVASLVGKPLGLDKNCLRNFSYVRVKIGCQDLSLVPSSRIGEIKKISMNSNILENFLNQLLLLATELVSMRQMQMKVATKGLQKDRELLLMILRQDPNQLLRLLAQAFLLALRDRLILLLRVDNSLKQKREREKLEMIVLLKKDVVIRATLRQF